MRTRTSLLAPAGVRATALVMALALGGCASLRSDPATDAPAPLAAPAQWTAAAGSAQPTALAQWWQRFNDPTLTGLVTQALQANTSVKSAQAALRQARAQRDAQAAANGPSVLVAVSVLGALVFHLTVGVRCARLSRG